MSKTFLSNPQAAPSASAAPAAGPYPAVADGWLTTIEAAKYLKVSKSFLDKLRVYGGGPPFVRLGPRKILYRQRDLDDWMAARRFSSTSQYGTSTK